MSGCRHRVRSNTCKEPLWVSTLVPNKAGKLEMHTVTERYDPTVTLLLMEKALNQPRTSPEPNQNQTRTKPEPNLNQHLVLSGGRWYQRPVYLLSAVV